jgi:hypothetical protein
MQLPEYYGNMGSVQDLSDETLSDLSFAVFNRGFLTPEAAEGAMSRDSLIKAKQSALPLVEEYIRTQRDHLLSITDIAATADRWNSLDVVAQRKITEYRQALRDITKQDVFNVKWPTRPTQLNFIQSYEWPADIPLSDSLKQTIEAPNQVLPMSVIQAEQWERIMALRDKKVAGGIKVNNMWFHTDTDSLIRYLALHAAGSNLPSNMQWKTMTGDFVTLTPSLVNDIYNASIIANNNIFRYAEQLKLQLMSSVNPASFDITQGWPETYK